MNRGPTGTIRQGPSLGGEAVRAFVPAPLPPEPPLAIDAALRAQLDEALLALGRLDSVSTLLPDPVLFLYTFIRKEAVLSSQIEGTQSSLSDLLLFELEQAPGAPVDDVREVSSYVRALEHGIARVRGGFPAVGRLAAPTDRGPRGAHDSRRLRAVDELPQPRHRRADRARVSAGTASRRAGSDTACSRQLARSTSHPAASPPAGSSSS